jgi:hypothetical protein
MFFYILHNNTHQKSTVTFKHLLQRKILKLHRSVATVSTASDVSLFVLQANGRKLKHHRHCALW